MRQARTRFSPERVLFLAAALVLVAIRMLRSGDLKKGGA